MLRRLLIAALPSAMLLAAARAQASEAGPKTDEGDFVELKPVGMPIVVGGRLVNYVFVTVRLNLASGANLMHWREKEPLFRDALVRAGYRTPFVVPNDDQKVDVAKLSAALLREAAAITGPGVVASVSVLSQDSIRRGRTTR